MDSDATSFDSYLQAVINNIKKSQNFSENVECDIMSGAEMGDGYSSRKFIVSLKEPKGKHQDYFVKCYPLSNPRQVFMNMFKNETIFYEKIRSAFYEFEVNRGIMDPVQTAKYFDIGNVAFQEFRPKPVILENLKRQNFRLRDRQTEADDYHMDLALRNYANFHAISFAMQDQSRELFEKLTSEVIDIFQKDFTEELIMDKVTESLIERFLDNLHPEEDQRILNALKGSVKKFDQYITTNYLPPDSHSVLLHGDAWSNNMMFLYDSEGKKPVDMRLIDFQFMRVNSPVIDLSYFFYSTATEEMMANLDVYQTKYHKYLSERIQELGSDPQLYPYEVFKKHWKKYCVFGFSLSFVLVKIMLYERDEVPNYTERLDEKTETSDMFSHTSKNQDKFQRRMKNICLHFLDNQFL